MEHAKIGIFDDTEFIRSVFREFLELDGHIVVTEAGSVETSMDAIDRMEPDSIDVAIVDGNFSGTRLDSAEGAEIAGAIRRRLPDVVIIGLSSAAPIEGADINYSKDNFTEARRYIKDL